MKKYRPIFATTVLIMSIIITIREESTLAASVGFCAGFYLAVWILEGFARYLGDIEDIENSKPL